MVPPRAFPRRLVLIGAAAMSDPVLATMPAPVEAMIREAARTGDPATLDAVTRVAAVTNPDDADVIAAFASRLRDEATARQKREREERLAAQTWVQGWKGEGQAGLGLTSGNSREISLVIGLAVKKEGLQTRHKIDALLDYLRSNDIITREKFAASYGVDYKLREGLYIYGIAGWERDRFAGYERRFTQSVGIGLRAINRSNMTLDLDVGPALRQTALSEGPDSFEVGPRGSVTYKWTPRDGVTVSEDASLISSEGRMTLLSNTALSSRFTDALSGRVSFNVQTETNRPAGSKPTDTATRATLVYKF